MAEYTGFVMLLNFFVDLLLLCGTDRLFGVNYSVSKVLSGAAIGAAYAGLCLLPAAQVLTGVAVRLTVLLIIAWVGLGLNIRKTALFFLLMTAVGGITTGFCYISVWEILTATVCLFVLLMTMQRTVGKAGILPMELSYGGRSARIMALQDTGNGLHDPITGEAVIVVSPKVAYEFTGLTKEQLRSPTDNLQLLPGGRLIPYRTVGTDNGFLLAIRFPAVKVGNKMSSALVAFAPAGFQDNGSFQALIGRGNG